MKKTIDKKRIERIIFEQILKESIKSVKEKNKETSSRKINLINENENYPEVDRVIYDDIEWRPGGLDDENYKWWQANLENTTLKHSGRAIGKVKQIFLGARWSSLIDGSSKESFQEAWLDDLGQSYRCTPDSTRIGWLLEADYTSGNFSVTHREYERHYQIDSPSISNRTVPSFCQIQEVENKNILQRISASATMRGVSVDDVNAGRVKVIGWPSSDFSWKFDFMTDSNRYQGGNQISRFFLERSSFDEKQIWISVGAFTGRVVSLSLRSDGTVNWIAEDSNRTFNEPWQAGSKIATTELSIESTEWEQMYHHALPTFGDLRRLSYGTEFSHPDLQTYDRSDIPSEGSGPFGGGWLELEEARASTSLLTEDEEPLAWISASNYQLPDGMTTDSQRRQFCQMGGTGQLGGTSRTWPVPKGSEDLWNGFDCARVTIVDGSPQTWERLQQSRATPPAGEAQIDSDEAVSSRGSSSGGSRRWPRGPSARKIIELQSLLGVTANGRWGPEIDRAWANEIRFNLADLFIPPNLLDPMLTDWGRAGRAIAGDLFQEGSSYDNTVDGMIRFLTLTRDTDRIKRIYYARPTEAQAGSTQGSELETRSTGEVRVNSIIVARPLVMTVIEIDGMPSNTARRVAQAVSVHAVGESENPLVIERLSMNRLRVSVPEGVEIKKMRNFKSTIKGMTEEGMKISLRIREIPGQS